MDSSTQRHQYTDRENREGARQPGQFDPARSHVLDDPARFAYLDPATVENLLDAPPGAEVVDFGTGTGTYALAIARRRQDIQMIALDEQPEMLALLRAKPELAEAPNVKLSLPWDIAGLHHFADRVLALNVLHEASNEALESIRAMLKPDGLVLWIDWNAAVERPVGPPRDHVYTPEEARERLETHGFAIISSYLFRFHYGFVTRAFSGQTVGGG